MDIGHIWPAPYRGTFFLLVDNKFRDIKSRQKVRRTSHRTKFGPADLDVHAEGGVPKKELVDTVPILPVSRCSATTNRRAVGESNINPYPSCQVK